MKDKRWKQWIFWFTFAIAAIVVYKTIDGVTNIFTGLGNFIDLLMPFFVAILIAYMLYIPAKSVEKTYKKCKFKWVQKKARGLSTLTVYILLLLIIMIIINVIIPSLSKSINDLAHQLPNYYNSAINFFNQLPEDSLLTKLQVTDFIKNLESINITEQIIKWFSIENINQYIKGIVGATGVVFDIFVTFVVSIYVLLERADIKSFFVNLSRAIFDEKTYEKIARYYHKTNSIFFSFVTSQILDAFIVGAITATAMAIMKVEYGVLLGFLIGLFNIIPYFGAIIGVLIAVIITIFTGGFFQAIWLAIVVIVLQQIDANIINPKILGSSLNLSPILVIFSVSIGGAYFGILGMFLGVPVTALLKIIVGDMIENRIQEKNLQKENKHIEE